MSESEKKRDVYEIARYGKHLEIQWAGRQFLMVHNFGDEGDMMFRAERAARMLNCHDDLLAALEGLAKEINLSKLDIRKDFSLMNAHACALKEIHKAKA